MAMTRGTPLTIACTVALDIGSTVVKVARIDAQGGLESQHFYPRDFEAGIGRQVTAILEERRLAFKARRDYLVPALRELGFGVPVDPTGGFFVYADCSRFDADCERFCRRTLQGAGVAFTPGIDFGTHRAEQHVRLAYTIDMPKLEEGIARLRTLLQS